MNRFTNDTDGELRALLLDHDAASRGGLRSALERRGCAVREETDGARGLAVLLDELLHLHALVVAADLPGRDARSFADLVRRAGGERDLALVVVAEHATAELRAELLRAGVDAVVPRSAGPDAAAEAALAAIATRSPPRLDAPERPRPQAAEERAPRWELLLARWSLLPA
jgi:DNA-binding NarL/FixJ family response regulator